jgi:hypothetical protein
MRPALNTETEIKSSVNPPCGNLAKTISVGRPGISGKPAFFTTKGDDLYITATGFEKGGFFDPKIGKTLLYIGKADQLPAVDLQRATVSNTLAQLQVTENEYTKQALDRGRYWILTSNTVEIQIASCGHIAS